MQHMCKASLASIDPGKHVSIDEQLILFKGRTRHSMMIASKEAGQGFKVYSLCVGNYLIWFKFTSKLGGIDGLQSIPNLPPSSSLIVDLMIKLPKQKDIAAYVVYLDNFFTSKKLLLELRARGFGACGTCKNGSGIASSLLELKQSLSKKRYWGIKALTTLDHQILCLAWQDNSTVLLMTTVHDVQEAQQQYPRDPKKRHQIPNDSYEWINGEKKLMFPEPIIDYNKHMGGSDGNAQQRATGSPAKHRDVRYWWPMFVFMLEACILNAHILFKLNTPKSRLSHREFQRQIAFALLRNPAGQSKQRIIAPELNRKRKFPGPEHEWIHLSKKKRCTACTQNRIMRKPLQPIAANPTKRKRPAETRWGCKHPDCSDKAICKPGCWDKAHDIST